MSETKQKTILLVEDQEFIAEIEKKQLEEKEGYNIIYADCGEKAIDIVCKKQMPIDLILMDIVLGDGMDGIDTAKEILKEHIIPILFLSATLEKDIIERTVSINTYGCVAKSMNFNFLNASIKMAFRLADADQKIRNLLTEKELVLKEVHHRIKNNMQTMGALLDLQAGIQVNPETSGILKDASGRLQSMMILYDKLYRSGNFGEISLKEYITSLTEEIISIFPGKVLINTQIDDILLNAQLLSPLGIVINELITNSMKYSFDSENGLIIIKGSRKGNLVSLVYEDNGVGLPDSISFENSTGFGMQLVKMLVEQIEGSIRIERGEGAKFVIDFEV
jgi:two-component system, chemotaxis family, CheB/CheR fusion protein